MGRIQTAVVHHPVVVRWLAWLTAGMGPDTLLQPGGVAGFSRMFKEALGWCGLASTHLSPGSLRPGGATSMFVAGVELARLRILGRWKNPATLDYYVQEAAAYRVNAQLSAQQAARVESTLINGRVFRKVPPQPWSHFFSRDGQQLLQVQLEPRVPYRVVWRA
jgi:hypothetical protein